LSAKGLGELDLLLEANPNLSLRTPEDIEEPPLRLALLPELIGSSTPGSSLATLSKLRALFADCLGSIISWFILPLPTVPNLYGDANAQSKYLTIKELLFLLL
jgi:hypothetical protein